MSSNSDVNSNLFFSSLPRFNYPSEKSALLERIFKEKGKYDLNIDARVAEIIAEVRSKGVDALVYYSEQFDGVKLAPQQFKVSQSEFDEINEESISNEFKAAVTQAIENIKLFHEKQLPDKISYTGKYGEQLGQRFTAMERVGVYVPGGKGGTTPLISTLMMNVLPAQIAGCEEIVAVTPPQVDGKVNPHLLYVFKELEISEVYKVGGAQAVAALAYGIDSKEYSEIFLSPVDIIVGPGNQYVLSAKKQIFGKVAIDGLFGHSEIVVVSDGCVEPKHVAADMLSQAEHAGGELVVLITDNKKHAEEVLTAIDKLLPTLDRADLIKKSLTGRGCVVLLEGDLSDKNNIETTTAELVNKIAPEHLELLVEDYRGLLNKIKHTGAIFLGGFASEPIGDYICGTNHVLPTGGAARFSSPLGVYTFLKRTNIIEYNQASFSAYAKHAEVLAEAEGLTAHKRALSIRT